MHNIVQLQTTEIMMVAVNDVGKTAVFTILRPCGLERSNCSIGLSCDHWAQSLVLSSDGLHSLVKLMVSLNLSPLISGTCQA